MAAVRLLAGAAAHAACRSLDHDGESRRGMPGGSSLVAINAVLVVRLPATRGDGEGSGSRFKVDHNRQVIRRTRQPRSSAIANAAPNARVHRGREKHFDVDERLASRHPLQRLVRPTVDGVLIFQT